MDPCRYLIHGALRTSVAADDKAVLPCRYLIHGALRTTSPLCIRSGLTWLDMLADLPAGERDRSFRPGDRSWLDGADVALVIRDASGLPYIPGSALKGVLCQFLERLALAPGAHADPVELVRRIQGVESRGKDSGSGGCVCFYDALVDEDWLKRRRTGQQCEPGSHLPWWNERDLTYIEPAVSIDRRTRTAAHHLLMHTEAVPPGIEFHFELLADTSDEAIWKLLVQALGGFHLDPKDVPIQLGSETANGWGRCRVSKLEVLKLTPGNNPAVVVHPEVPELNPVPPVQLLARHADVANSGDDTGQQSAPAEIEPASAARQFTHRIVLGAGIELAFDGPFIVNDPSQCPKKEQGEEGPEDDGSAEDRPPDHAPRQTHDGRALLPSRSFRGAFRSQLERIVRTLVDGAAVSPHRTKVFAQARDESSSREPCDAVEYLPIESPLRMLFGLTEQQSCLWVSDFEWRATAENEQPPKIVRQEMVAIDRWTGGAAERFKYNVEYWESPTLRGTLRLTLSDDDAALGLAGLVALALRDLCEGDITFGLGAGKGFGQCVAKLTDLRVLGLPQDTDSRWRQRLIGHQLPVKDQELNAMFHDALSPTPAVRQAALRMFDSALDKLLKFARDQLPTWVTHKPTEKANEPAVANA